MSDKKQTSDIEALIFRPNKVSWGVQKAIIKLNPTIERITLLTIILALSAAAVWSHFSQKAIVVDATGEIVPVAAPIPMIAKSNFTIRRIPVKDNQALQKGDVVLETTRFLEEGEKEDIQRVFAELAELLKTEKDGKCTEVCLAALKAHSEDGLAFQDKIDQQTEFHRNILELNKSLKDYLIQLRLFRSLPETLVSLNNEMRILQKRIQEIERRKAQKILGLEYEEFQSKVISLRTQIRERELNTKSSLDNARTNYDITLGKTPQSFKKYLEDAIVTAPTSGRVRFANLKGVGQTFNPGETLFLMTQDSSELWLKFQVGEVDLSKVKPSQEARIDLSSYPASEYGIQKATVVEVLDKLPVENEQQRNPNFVGFAKLHRQDVEFKEKTYPLRIGMQGKVKIIVKHESVLTIFIKRIFSLKDEYLGDVL
jgi:multidrug efflux pump subunit AcrA (membrane-fusion protein)